MVVPINQRVPNNTLRDIRLAMHMSQTEFARAVQHAGQVLGEPNTCNKRLIQKWESGEHTDCRPNYRRALCTVTQKPYTQLGFTGSSSLPAALDQMPKPMPHLPVPEAAQHNIAGDDAAHRLRHALPAPAHADADMVAVTEISLTQLFTDEGGTAARIVVESAYEQLQELSALLAGTSRGPLRRRLLTAAGACAAVAGQLTYEIRRPRTAERLWDAASAAAQRAGDRSLAACVLAYRAQAVADQANPDGAWHLVHNALMDVDDDPHARAWLASQAAKYSAYLDYPARALDEITKALADAPTITTGERDSAAPWLRFLDGAYLHATAAHVYTTLGDAHTALDHAQRARQLLGPSRTKTRALTLAEIAYAAAYAKESALMTEHVYEAAELTDFLEARQARDRLRALRHLIKPVQDQPDYRAVSLRLDPYSASDSDGRLPLGRQYADPVWADDPEAPLYRAG